MNEEKIKQEFGRIWKKIEELESNLNKDYKSEKQKKTKKGYSGLAGGIRFLIEQSFLNKPKFVKEIYEELKREYYHYPKKSVEKLLSVNFMKNKRILTRIKEGKRWKYVIRK